MLLGPLPIIGRPPFLGPLVKKLAATEATLGGLDWSLTAARPLQQLSTGLQAAVGGWGPAQWVRLFELLANNPPRDLQPGGIAFLRSLPMYRLVRQPRLHQLPSEGQEEQQEQQRAGGGGIEGSAGGGSSSHLVALGDGGQDEWILAPAALLQACAGKGYKHK